MLTIKTILKYHLWLPSVISLLLVFIGLPIWILSTEKVANEPLGINIKVGDRIFYNFIDRVKKEDGIIILGTSETGNTLDGDNYWGLLDRDEDLNRNFYSFGGAGRCSYVYFPLILDNPKAFEDLEVILYVNPTYWRSGLNNFRKNYYTRYVDPLLALSVKKKAADRGIYTEFLAPGIDKTIGATGFLVDRAVGNFRSLYHSDLQQLLGETLITTDTKNKISISEAGALEVLEAARKEIDFRQNCSNDFLATNTAFPIIDTASTFQDEMLAAFIHLTQEFNINCTFYIGPFNEVYCNETAADRVEEHQLVVENIKNTLENKKVKYIDGSYQSKIPGTFLDIQHISKYGAYLTALDIKKYYEKNH